MSLYSEHAQNVNRLQERRARIEADRIRGRGEFIGGTLQMLGQLPLQLLQQRDQRAAQQRDESRQAQRDELGQLEIQDKLSQRASTRELSDALRQAKTPLDVATVWERFDPDKAETIHERNRNAAARILEQSTAGNWAESKAAIQKYVPPEFAAGLPDTYPDTPDFSWKVQTVRDWTSTPRDYVAQNTPKPTDLMEGYGPDGTTPAMVPKVAGATPYKAPPPGLTPDQMADNARADKQLAISQGQLDVARQRAGGSGSGGALTAGQKKLIEAVIANPAIYDNLTPTAKTEIAAELNARGFKFQTKADAKPATGAQNKVLGFFNRAKQADDDLQSVEAAVADMGLMEQNRLKFAPNFAQTQVGQTYNQAQRAFTEARLRKDSGAAIPEAEFANDRRTYFAQPGDSPDTLAQKARARAAVLASLGFEAGPALSGFYGEEAEGLINDYRARAQRGAASVGAPKEGDTKPIPGYPGTEQTFQNGKWIRTK